MSLPPDTIESLRNQRDLLGDTLGRLLVAIGMTRADAPLTGPELLLAAETAIECSQPNCPRSQEIPVLGNKPRTAAW